jgi:uroporphyrinogen decarboxylase
VNPDPHFDRIRTALYCGEPDRVPLAEVLIDEEAKEAFLGKTVNDLATDVEFYKRAGYDYVSLGRRMAGFPGVWDAARSNSYYEAQRPVGRGAMKGVIYDWDDFRSYPWMKHGDLDFRILDEAERILPAEMKVIRYLGPLFQMTWLLMGFEGFSYTLAENPQLVEAIFERVAEIVHWEFEDAIQRDVIGAIWFVDDIAIKDRLMVSPDFLRKHLFPRMKIMGDKCKERGIPLIYHTDGNISRVLQDLIDVGVNALHPIDPTGMDIYEVKRQVAGKLCIIGNIDVDLLHRGTPEEVTEDTRKHLKLLASGGGYVVSSSNSIVRTMKTENYRAMLETTLKHGKYPIDMPN